jgi:gliding motility-associated-like protein
MTITFPDPIVPLFTPDITWACQPGRFTFTNNSNNAGEIETVLVDFGDGQQQLIQGDSSVTHDYVNPQSYTLNVIVTSIYGCVYTANFPGIVQVIAKPEADFTISSNPTTIFETTVVMQDQSTDGVVSWEWSSPGSVPVASTQQNPTFDFPDGIVANYPIQLIVETPEGCVDTVNKILVVNSDILFFAPNAFTPDGDEYNQTWNFSIIGVDEFNFELLIFNRWGELIWETHDIHSEWDGTYNGRIIPDGTYTWVASVKDIYTDQKKEFSGFIEVVK